MKELLDIGLDLQIMLFSGYLAHHVTEIGRAKVRASHDAVFRVIGFALVISLAWQALAASAQAGFGGWFDQVPEAATEAIKVATHVLLALLAARLWQRYGRSAYYGLMRKTGGPQDDGEQTALRTLLRHGRNWHYIKVWTTDGAILQSDLSKLPPDEMLPAGRLTLNDDGIAMHVTSKARPDAKTTTSPLPGKKVETPIVYGNEGHTRITYVPVSAILRVEIGWRR